LGSPVLSPDTAGSTLEPVRDPGCDPLRVTPSNRVVVRPKELAVPEDLPPRDKLTDRPPESRCLQCGTRIDELTDAVVTDDGVFCSSCFSTLRQHLEQVVRAQSTDINYPAAALGGVLGGAAGALVWWGFTVLTRISFGLVAIVIGIAVGHGVTRFAGGKRSRGLQGLSVAIATLSFFYAQYLVNRTFILRAFAEKMPHEGVSLPLLPDPEFFFDVVTVGFGIFDLVFLAIVIFEAYKIPAPWKPLFSGSE
jgi:hypothetical protein